MKRFWKIGLLLLIFILAFIPTAMAVDLSVTVDGKGVYFPDAKPFINQDNRTMVPIRFISQELGGQVVWNEADRKVEISYNGKLVVIIIDQTTYFINGQAKEMDTRAVIVKDRTMVPIRFISEALGAGVHWDSDKYIVSVATVPVLESQPTQTIGKGQAIVQYTPGALNFKKICLTSVNGVDGVKYMVSETTYLTSIGEELIFLPEGGVETGSPTTSLKIYDSNRKLVAEGSIKYPTDVEVGSTINLTIDLVTYK